MELKHRSALPQALHNRSPETMRPILKWMQQHLSDPRYTSIIIDVTYQILDIYGADLIEDPNVAYVLEGIRRKVEKEVDKADKSQAVIGLLEMISK
jgi:U3 small nucleolar RNA-associated protein 15